jgi:hypothetical protein
MKGTKKLLRIDKNERLISAKAYRADSNTQRRMIRLLKSNEESRRELSEKQRR